MHCCLRFLIKLVEGKDPRELYGYHVGCALVFFMPCYLDLVYRFPSSMLTHTSERCKHNDLDCILLGLFFTYRKEVGIQGKKCACTLSQAIPMNKYVTISITSYQAHNILRTLDRGFVGPQVYG